MSKKRFNAPVPFPDVFIPGDGGAVLRLAAVPIIERGEEFEIERPGLDISLIDPERIVTFRSRPFTALDAFDLHRFLTAAAIDPVPEVSAPTFQSVGLGLILTVPSSEDGRIDLNIAVSVVSEGYIIDTEEFRYTTTRTAVLLAADHTRAISDEFGYIVGQTLTADPAAFAASNDQKDGE